MYCAITEKLFISYNNPILYFLLGHFMSVQGYKRVPGKSSQLDTPLISFPTGGDNVCVRFWYNMRGSMPLNVYFTVPDEIAVNDDPIWTRIGSNVPRGWNYAQFAVPRDSPPFQVLFVYNKRSG